METNMITNTRQNWIAGHTVKVGFMTLIVKVAISTPGDYAPDAYILSNQAGTQLYKFVPHKGLEQIEAHEVKALLEWQKACENMKASHQAEMAVRASEINAVFA